MTQKNSEREESAGGGSRRTRAKSNTDNTYKKYIITFRLNEKRKVHKRPVNEPLFEKLADIEKRVEELKKQSKKMKTTANESSNHDIGHEIKNLMTDACIVDVDIQNIIGRDAEDIELSRLLRDVIDELMYMFMYRYPLLANVVRIPQFIQNVKSFQVPKYVVCTLLLMGSTVLKDDDFFKVFTEERRKRALNYTTEYMKNIFIHPDCLGIWTMQVLSRYYSVTGLASQCTKYFHLATKLAISMKLHMVDAHSVSTPEKEGKYSIVEKELGRRLWWSIYIYCMLVSEGLTLLPAIQLKDIFVNLPSNDRLWHCNTSFVSSNFKAAYNCGVILNNQGEFKFDTFGSYVMLNKIRYGIVTFINRREITIAKDMKLDYRRYLKLFTNATVFQRMMVMRFHNELENILTFSVRNPGIVNAMNIEYFILRYCTLMLNTCVTNLHLNASEVAYYENVDISPERVKAAKVILINNTIYFIEVFYWLLSTFPIEKFDLELNYLISHVFRHLTNLEYIRNLSRHNAIVNGKKVIIEYFEQLKATTPLAKMYFYLANNISDLKKSYDKANSKFKNIPENFKKMMLSSYDYNPWLVPNGSNYYKRECCFNTLSSKIHEPFLLSRIFTKESLSKNGEFLLPLDNESDGKQIIMAIDLKPAIKEAEKLNLILGDLGISKKQPQNHEIHTNNNPSLDDDPRKFFVKVVNRYTSLQNTALLEQCKNMLERVYHSILSANYKEMSKTQSPTFDQNFPISKHKDYVSGFDFTELLYNPIEQAQRCDTTSGCEFISKDNTHVGFNATISSMGHG